MEKEYVPIGTKVKMKKSKNFSNRTNEERVGRVGTITDVFTLLALHTMYTITLDEPIKDAFGYTVTNYHVYDFNDAFEVIA